MAARLLHGGLEAKCAHVDVRHSFIAALFAQPMTPVSNPGRGLGELRARCLALMLRFRATVRGEVIGGEGGVSEEAGPNPCPLQRRLQAPGVPRRQLEALNEESFGLLGAHLGHLFDMGVHEFGELGCVDRVLVGGLELGQDPAQYRAYHIGRQPRDPLSLQAPLSQHGLAHPGRTTDQVENAAPPTATVCQRAPAAASRPVLDGAMADSATARRPTLHRRGDPQSNRAVAVQVAGGDQQRTAGLRCPQQRGGERWPVGDPPGVGRPRAAVDRDALGETAQHIRVGGVRGDALDGRVLRSSTAR
jgi:hypothetical protein